MYRKKYHIHFVGIGGIGMSGIAELLLNLGYQVSGSDLAASDITQRLAGLGGTIHQGHDAAQTEGADVVVTSSAVDSANPEVVAARKAMIPVIPRAEMLAELMRLRYSIAVAGAHGKTSTTSIVASLLDRGGLDPTVVIGGKLKGLGSNAVLGKGEYLVAEADESDGSFLRFAPTIAVVTNIDLEHLDFYKDLAEIQTVFVDFIHRIPFYGLAVVCLDSEPVQEIIPRIGKRFTTYGLTSQADLQALNVQFEGLRSHFEVRAKDNELGAVTLNLPGRHSVYNALAGIAVALELGIDFDTIRQALESLEGVQRRLEIKGEFNGATVVDDYGHHPTEIKTTLQAVRDAWPGRRLRVVFQPHRYSRTQALFDDFATAFYQCDELWMLPIYAASEAPLEGVDSRVLFRAIQDHGHRNAHFADSLAEAAEQLGRSLQPGDILLTLGAGNVHEVGRRILEKPDAGPHSA
ncbi:MAG: UDP-N-acetylmuramate--L-alanine ligase [Desulfobacterales bacterium]